MPSPRLLDPKLDFVFKRLFAESPDLLIDLINAVRNLEPPVVELRVLNPQIAPEELQGKQIVLDILAVDETGKRFNIEMQTSLHAGWSSRSVYYLARALGELHMIELPKRPALGRFRFRFSSLSRSGRMGRLLQTLARGDAHAHHCTSSHSEGLSASACLVRG